MNVAIIGLGLIGGSMLKALAAGGHRVIGYDADPQTREAAERAGYPVARAVGAAVAGTDLAVLAVPLPALPAVLAELVAYDGLVTDVTSVKAPVRDLVTAHGLRRFVGGHPMAGKETSGFAAADPTLFDGCAWVLCLEPDTDLADWLALAALVTGLRSRAVPATAAEHDRAVAAVSHVPHLLAAALALHLVDNPLAATLAAGSFRDGTRVAATRAELTAAMCGGNAGAVRDVLARTLADLDRMLADLKAGDPVGALLPALRQAGDARRHWPPQQGGAAGMAAEPAALLALGRAGGWLISVAADHTHVIAVQPENVGPSS